MAIHAGEATPKDGDYLAPALNRLARVLATGYGEQILLTDTARALATTLPLGYALQDLGKHRLRDLIEAERIFQLCGPGLPAEFPPLKSLDQQPTNLPTQPTALIGRERELAALRAVLSAPRNSAHHTGWSRRDRQDPARPAGSRGVAGELRRRGLVGTAGRRLRSRERAAGGRFPLGIREGPAQPLLEGLAAHLRSRQTLLLLDNFEHLRDAAPQIQHLLTVRAGARRARHQPGTVAPAVRSGSFPSIRCRFPSQTRGISVEDALDAPAVRLFVERAQAVKPAFALDAANVADVVAICRRLDGLPLAIELAAARVRILPPAALLARLDQRLSILTGGARDLPERQQTLRAAIAWSYDLLVPPERALFARLAVFAGGCTLEAAEAVCSAAGGLPLDLLDGIDSLVQKSLLRQEEGPGGDPRFTMLETIREFAQERLHELPEANGLRQAHADTLLALAENVHPDDFSGEVDLLNRLEADHANLSPGDRVLQRARARPAWPNGCASWPPSPTSGGRTGISPKAGAN